MKNRNFLTHHEGTAIIEFAIVAPLLFLLLAGIIELGLILFATSAIEGATNVGARIGQTGFSSSGMSREDYIRSEVRRLTGGLISPSSLSISILSYSSFANIGQPEPCISPASPPCPGVAGVNFMDINGNTQWDADQGSASAGGSGSVVLYRVSYPWRLFTPLMSRVIGSGGILTITATSAVRNEEFQ